MLTEWSEAYGNKGWWHIQQSHERYDSYGGTIVDGFVCEFQYSFRDFEPRCLISKVESS